VGQAVLQGPFLPGVCGMILRQDATLRAPLRFSATPAAADSFGSPTGAKQQLGTGSQRGRHGRVGASDMLQQQSTNLGACEEELIWGRAGAFT
jgi:hypothetical protein